MKKILGYRSLSLLNSMSSKIVGHNILNKIRAKGYQVRIGIPRELNIPFGSTVVQVGMWRLENAVRLANAIGGNGRALILEASPPHAEKISNELQRLGYKNVTVINCAAWSENTEIELQLSDDPSGHQVDGVDLDMPMELRNKSVKVPARRVDDVAREHGITEPDYMEVTVNGAELHVLKGMPNMVASCNRLLVAGMMREAGVPQNQVVSAYLNELGYRTVISKSGYKISDEWGNVDGHVFAYR